jgi:hypothetical protein
MPSDIIMSHFRFIRHGGILMREERGSALGSLAMTPVRIFARMAYQYGGGSWGQVLRFDVEQSI